MARTTSTLTDTEIKKAKSGDKDYKLFDGGGLFLLIKKSGGKLWRLKYKFENKEKLLSLGTYPDTSLTDARTKRKRFKEELARGINPSDERKTIKTHIEAKEKEDEARKEGQFHLVVYGWLAMLQNDEATKKKRKRAFERDIFPYLCEYDKDHKIISSKHIGDIKHPELLEIIKIKEKTAAETARRLLTDCNRLWLYAISHGHAKVNITANISKKDALKASKSSHYAKITDEKTLGELLRAIDTYKGGFIVRNALRFVSIIPFRADNLCRLQWKNVDFETNLITIPRSDMKVKDKKMSDFIIPLPHQAIEILKEVREITGWGRWVFHGIKDDQNHLNKESANKALRALGFNDEVNGRKQTLHSFRGTFGSLSETYSREHGISFEARERVLDHQESNTVVRAYTHQADYTEHMRVLLQWWADFLDKTKQKE